MREPKLLLQLQVKLLEATDERASVPFIVEATEAHYFVMNYRCFDSLDEIWGHICERLCANRTNAVAANLEKAAVSFCGSIQSYAHELMAASDRNDNDDDNPIQLSWEVEVIQNNIAGGDGKELHSDDSWPAAAPTLPAPAPTLQAASRKRKREDDDDEREKMCVVCQEKLRRAESMAVLPCSHEYHEGCILEWLQRDKTCPLCRFKLPENGWQASSFHLKSSTDLSA